MWWGSTVAAGVGGVGEVTALLEVRMLRRVNEHGPRWMVSILRFGKLGDNDLQALVVAQAKDAADALRALGADGRGDVERADGARLFPVGLVCDRNWAAAANPLFFLSVFSLSAQTSDPRQSGGHTG